MRLTLQMGTALHAFGVDLTRLSPGKGTSMTASKRWRVMRYRAASEVVQCSISISKSLSTRRRTRTVLSSELSSKDFRFIPRYSSESVRRLVASQSREAVVNLGGSLRVVRSVAGLQAPVNGTLPGSTVCL